MDWNEHRWLIAPQKEQQKKNVKMICDGSIHHHSKEILSLKQLSLTRTSGSNDQFSENIKDRRIFLSDTVTSQNCNQQNLKCRKLYRTNELLCLVKICKKKDRN